MVTNVQKRNLSSLFWADSSNVVKAPSDPRLFEILSTIPEAKIHVDEMQYYKKMAWGGFALQLVGCGVLMASVLAFEETPQIIGAAIGSIAWGTGFFGSRIMVKKGLDEFAAAIEVTIPGEASTRDVIYMDQ